MPEYRHDPLSDRWVIIAPDRAGRPDQFSPEPERRRSVAPCPFCAGHEEETPPTLACYPSTGDDARRWQVRVVGNKYPAVWREGATRDSPPVGSRTELERVTAGVGAHEVIIESPDHVVSFSELSEEQAVFTFLAYRDRMQALKADTSLAYAQVFKNARAEGGATLEHSHSQLIATTTVPTDVQREFARAGEYRLLHGRCVFCELVARLDQDATRQVAATEHFVAMTPFASRFPYETWILPRGHRECYEQTEQPVVAELASLVRELVSRFEQLFERPAYNYWIHTAPFQRSPHDVYHWHLEMAPRLARLAGFELGVGCFINSVSPEDAARRLRSPSAIAGTHD